MLFLMQIIEVLVAPFKLFLNPEKRIFWPYLLSSLLIVVSVVTFQKYFLKNRTNSEKSHFSEKNLNDNILKMFGVNGMKVDLQLLFLTTYLKVFFALFLLISPLPVIFWCKNKLIAVFGVSDFTTTQNWIVVLLFSLSLFLIHDLTRFLLHRLMHKNSFLWAFHQVHHSAEHLNPLTLYRTHPIESLLYACRSWLVNVSITAIFLYLFSRNLVVYEFFGVAALSVIFSAFNANLRHSHLFWSYGNFLENLFISPAQHQIHHRKQGEIQNSNFGSWLSVWDRLTGSLVLAACVESAELEFGLDSEDLNHSPNSALSILISPIRSQLIIFFKMTGVHSMFSSNKMSLFILLISLSCFEAVHAEENSDSSDIDNKVTIPIEETFVEEIFVDVQKKSAPGTTEAAQQINKEDLERFAYDDVQQVLNQTPGTYVRGEDGFGLRPNIGLRGVSAERSAKITLMEDGVLFAPAPYSAPAAYYFPLMSRVTGVEVFKGPAALRHGPNTIGGAINLKSREVASETGLNLDIGYGWNNSLRLQTDMAYRQKYWAIQLEAAQLSSDGFKQLDSGGETGFVRREIVSKFHVHSELSSEFYQELKLKVSLGQEKSNESYLGLSEKDFSDNPIRRYSASQKDQMNWSRQSITANYLLSFGQLFDLEAIAYRNTFQREWFKFNGFKTNFKVGDVLAFPDTPRTNGYYQLLTGETESQNSDEYVLIGNNKRQYSSQGAQLLLNSELTLGIVEQLFHLSLRVHHDDVQRIHDNSEYAVQKLDLVQKSQAEVFAKNSASSSAFSAYFHDEITLDLASFGQLTAVPSMRIELIRNDFNDLLSNEKSERWQNAILPGLSINYKPVHVLSLFAGVYKGFSPVAPGQDSGVVPEESINYQLGTHYFDKGLEFEATAFFNDYSNLSGQCSFSSGCDQDNLQTQFSAGRVWVYGAESQYRQRMTLPWNVILNVQASYALTLSEFQNDFKSSHPQMLDVKKGDSIAYIPEHQLSSVFQLQKEAFSMSLSANMQSAMRDVASGGEIEKLNRIPAFATLDSSFNYQMNEKIAFYLRVNNILNNTSILSRRPFGVRPNRGINGMIGIKVNL